MSGKLLQEKALLVSLELGHDNFTTSNGWLESGWLQHLNELKQYALHNDNCKIMLLCAEIETEVQNNQLNKQNRQTSILDFFNKK